jgi:hypothetical protein
MIDPFHFIHMYGTLGLCMAYGLWGAASMAAVYVAIEDLSSRGARAVAAGGLLSAILCISTLVARLV